jgi:hypothetical protein
MVPGPSLEQYVETRFNLLLESIKDKTKAQDESIVALSQAARLAVDALRATYEAAQVATDLRYQQRFEAQSDALAAAFLSQQTAMQTALQAAKEAVQAALAAADRAVAKAETAADKRFEALNELRQMLNDMVATLITRVEAVQRFDGITEKVDAHGRRTDALEARFNTLSGSLHGTTVGREKTMDSSRANLGVVVAVIASLIALGGLVWTLAERLSK